MKIYGLIGFPLTHSFSKQYFYEKFKNELLTDCTYENFEISTIDQLKKVIQNNPHLAGINITIPFKESVMDILDSIDERATLIGAVNTVRIIKENDTTHLKGYNTDCIGFDKSITPLLKSYHDKALVLGTGGSSKAVAFVLRHKGIDVKMVSRNAAGHALSYDELSPEIMEAYKIIINCTPVGMFPAVSAFPEIPYHLLGERHLLFDLIYNPDETVFLKNGKIKNATVKNGYEMLCLQAEASWQIWNTMD